MTKINSLNPDIVLLVGDIIEGDRQDAEMAVLEKTLQKLLQSMEYMQHLGTMNYTVA